MIISHIRFAYRIRLSGVEARLSLGILDRHVNSRTGWVENAFNMLGMFLLRKVLQHAREGLKAS